MIKCPRCGNESIKELRLKGLIIRTCLVKDCKYRLTINLINNTVRTDKD